MNRAASTGTDGSGSGSRSRIPATRSRATVAQGARIDLERVLDVRHPVRGGVALAVDEHAGHCAGDAVAFGLGAQNLRELLLDDYSADATAPCLAARRAAMMAPVEQPLFDAVGEMLRGMLSSELDEVRCRARRYGIKVWFGSETPSREHYEAQVIGAEHVDDATVLALEVGFHTEHPDAAKNDAVLARLLEHEDGWRPVLGDEAVVGPFLGRPDPWRRVSETWPDPDLGDADLAVEIAVRLSEYVSALEPVRRGRAAAG